MTAPDAAGIPDSRSTPGTAPRASYVYLTRGPVAHTIEVTDSLMVDIDEDGRLVGVENLGDGDWRNALARLAMDGKLRAAIAAAAPAGTGAPACPECHGTGLVDVGHCNCGSPADSSIGYAHEPLCGAEQCQCGAWDKLHPEQPQAAPELAAAMAETRKLRELAIEMLATFGTPSRPATVRWTGKQVEQWRKRAGLQP